nr:MAG TPA: 40S ribosomal subunit ribosome [Caudoviricetes sp.]
MVAPYPFLAVSPGRIHRIVAAIPAGDLPHGSAAHLVDEGRVGDDQIGHDVLTGPAHILYMPFGIGRPILGRHIFRRVGHCHRLALKGGDGLRREHIFGVAHHRYHCLRVGICHAHLPGQIVLAAGPGDGDIFTDEVSLGRLDLIGADRASKVCDRHLIHPRYTLFLVGTLTRYRLQQQIRNDRLVVGLVRIDLQQLFQAGGRCDRHHGGVKPDGLCLCRQCLFEQLDILCFVIHLITSDMQKGVSL